MARESTLTAPPTRRETSSPGPFAYNTCADRDADGLIATSRGLGDIRPWTNAGGIDNDGGVTNGVAAAPPPRPPLYRIDCANRKNSSGSYFALTVRSRSALPP